MMILEHVDESDGFIKVSPIESMQKVMGGNLSRPRSHSGKMGHGKATEHLQRRLQLLMSDGLLMRVVCHIGMVAYNRSEHSVHRGLI